MDVNYVWPLSSALMLRLFCFGSKELEKSCRQNCQTFRKPGLLRAVARQQYVGSSVTAVKHLVLQSQPLLCNLCQCVIDELEYAHRKNA